MSPAMPLPPFPPELAARTARASLEKGTGRVYGGLAETDLVGVEQRRVGHARCRWPQPEMAPRGRRRDPAARRAGEQTRPDEEGLGDGLEGLRPLRDSPRQCGEPHRAATEAAQQGVEDCAIEPIETDLVDLVDLQCRPGDVAGHHAVSADLGEVTHPAQQPVGDAGRAAGPSGDLLRAVRPQRYVEEGGAAHENLLELGGGVEVEVGDEAEPVAQRAGQKTGPSGRADKRERCDLERDRGRARTLADDDVDPEVLHRDVEHLLRRSRHPVDLVEEEHLALTEGGEQGGEVAGPFDRRPGGDPQRCPDLGGKDHRQRRLAEPGRTRQQDVVRRPAALLCRCQDEPELLTHPLLTHELRESLRSQRRLDHRVVAFGIRGHELCLARLRHDFSVVAHARLSLWRLARSSAATPGASPTASAASASGPTAASASSTSRAPQPRPVSAARSCSRHTPTPVGGPPTGNRPAPMGAPSRSLSSSTRRCAPLRPTPGTSVRAPRSSVATAARTASGECTASTACASFGPTPLTDCRMSKTTRSSSVPNPNSVSESSRTTMAVASRTGSPGRRVPSVAGVQWTARPTPPTSTTAVSAPTAATVPVTLAIIACSPSCLLHRWRRPLPPDAAACRRATAGRWRAQGRRPRPPGGAETGGAAPW